jgi:hypothetical protein
MSHTSHTTSRNRRFPNVSILSQFLHICFWHQSHVTYEFGERIHHTCESRHIRSAFARLLLPTPLSAPVSLVLSRLTLRWSNLSRPCASGRGLQRRFGTSLCTQTYSLEIGGGRPLWTSPGSFRKEGNLTNFGIHWKLVKEPALQRLKKIIVSVPAFKNTSEYLQQVWARSDHV